MAEDQTSSAGAGAFSTSSAPPAGSAAPAVAPPTTGGTPLLGSKLVVNRRQDGNPVLKYVRNVPYEWSSEIKPDFVCFRTCGLLYLTLKWHKLHPAYLESRYNDLNQYELKILLLLSNVEEPAFLLRDLNILCYRSGWTLLISYSVEEAAEYIENCKLAETRNPMAVIQNIQQFRENRFQPPRPPSEREKNRKLFEEAVKFLSSIRAVSSSDAKRLIGAFGSVVAISHLSQEQLALCPGLGPTKAENVFKFFNAQLRLTGSK